jgi:hypothetical protein
MDEMTKLADLGMALAPAATPTATPTAAPAHLWERVAADLALAGDAVPVPVRRRWQGAALVAASAAAVAATAAALMTGTAVLTGAAPRPGVPPAQSSSAPGGTAPGSTAPGGTVATSPAAFTVVANADGSITFTARDFVDPVAATAALHRAGLAGRVVNSRAAEGCHTPGGHVNSADLFPTGWGTMTYGRSVTLRTTDYPPGGGVLVAVRADPAGTPRNTVSLELLRFKRADRIPTCVDWLYTS